MQKREGKEEVMIRALHLATFSGNPGDVASHNGLYNAILKGIDITYTQLELRKFYQNVNRSNRLFFDDEFIRYVNTFDLLIIGGGAFFAISTHDSMTATIFDFDFEEIRIPIIFNSLGTYEEVGDSKDSEKIKKYSAFFKYIVNQKNILVTVRNDGSLDDIKKYCEISTIKKIHTVFDCGFYADIPHYEQAAIVSNKKNVAINIAGNLQEERFKNIGSDCLKKEIADLCVRLIDEIENVNIIFVPHIFDDANIISEICAKIPDSYRRFHISVAPLLCLQENSLVNFDLYRKCDCCVVMRNHAAIVPIGMGCEIIAISTLSDFRGIIQSLGLESNNVDVNDGNLCENLFRLIYSKIYTNKNANLSELNDELLRQKNSMSNLYRTWLCEQGLLG